ncbi:MAG: hypothetical protein WCW40_08365 [Bacteroidota bacterium]
MHQYKIFIFLIQVILIAQPLISGFERTSQPTQVFSRGMSGSALYSAENIWLNPASIARISSMRTTVFYSPSPFQLEQLSNYGLIISRAFPFAAMAVGFSSFGFSLYRESTGSLFLGALINDEFAAGIGWNLYHLSIEHYGSSINGVLDAGMIYSLSEQFNISLVIQNVNGASFDGEDDIPRVLISGISYALTERGIVHVDIVKDVRFPLAYRAGFNVRLHENIVVNAGTRTDSSLLCGGIGIVVSDWQVDYGIASHAELGVTHSLGITYHP